MILCARFFAPTENTQFPRAYAVVCTNIARFMALLSFLWAIRILHPAGECGGVNPALGVHVRGLRAISTLLDAPYQSQKSIRPRRL